MCGRQTGRPQEFLIDVILFFKCDYAPRRFIYLVAMKMWWWGCFCLDDSREETRRDTSKAPQFFSHTLAKKGGKKI